MALGKPFPCCLTPQLQVKDNIAYLPYRVVVNSVVTNDSVIQYQVQNDALEVMLILEVIIYVKDGAVA